MKQFIRGLLAVAVLSFAVLSFAVQSMAAEKKPNLLIFYADDLGWGELGCQGEKQIPTPNIDAIAAGGVRFTQGYVAATYCSPSRAGLLTGRYPTRFGHEFNSVAKLKGLSLDETTIADRLKQLGYATACIGKWHLGMQPEYRPTKRGFDEFYGTLTNTPFFHPVHFVDSRRSDDVREIKDKDFYTTDAYADRAVDWLERHKDQPWFLYVPFNAQHAPLEAPQKYLDRFPNIEIEKRRIFAAMLSAMDDAVGKIMKKVHDLGETENTMVFYIADNGGPTQSTTSKNNPLRGYKMTTYEGGPRVPFMVQWKGTISGGKVYDSPVLNLDVLPTAVIAAGGKIKPEDKIDGVDLLPFLRGESTKKPHETIYWRFGRQWAVRHGDFKLVVSNGGSNKPELYNLADDISESNDLATAHPEKAAELQKLWNAWNNEQAEASVPDMPSKRKQGNKVRGGKKPASP